MSQLRSCLIVMEMTLKREYMQQHPSTKNTKLKNLCTYIYVISNIGIVRHIKTRVFLLNSYRKNKVSLKWWVNVRRNALHLSTENSVRKTPLWLSFASLLNFVHLIMYIFYYHVLWLAFPWASTLPRLFLFWFGIQIVRSAFWSSAGVVVRNYRRDCPALQCVALTTV